MIMDDEEVAQADIIVLPPSKVDDQSDCEAVDENDLALGDALPNDVAGLVEVEYKVDKHALQHSGVKRNTTANTELQQLPRKSGRARKENMKYLNDTCGLNERKRKRVDVEKTEQRNHQ